VIPTYNGARTLPNLVPLLASLLARAGIPVLLHGQASEPAGGARPRARVATLEVLRALGIAECAAPSEAAARWSSGEPAFVPLTSVAPGLSRLIGLRRRLGVRNVAHTLAKVLRPVEGPSLLLSSYTHPEFGQVTGELFAATRAFALSMRGTEGEAVANVRRAQRIDLWVDGGCTAVVPAQEIAGPSVELPPVDAASTAAWIRDVVDAQRPVPAAIQTQIDAIRDALKGYPHACGASAPA
jgi:anthranilate phosphoribosyltransferase